MPYEFTVTRRVEFSDTDMAGIMHFANFFRFMETAEHGFYRSMGFSVVLKNFDPPLGFPRVHAACDFKKPLRFEDLVEVQLLVQEKRSKTLSYVFRFRNVTREPAEEVARGRVTVVCVTHGTDGKMASVPIPASIADQIQVAPKELLE